MEPKGRLVHDSTIQQNHWFGLTSPTQPVTTAWQYSEPLYIRGLTQLTAYITMVLGAADWVEFQFLYGFSADQMVPRKGTGTLVKHLTGDYAKRLSFPILDNYVQIAVRGFGAGGFATTLFACDVIAGDAALADDLQPSGPHRTPVLSSAGAATDVTTVAGGGAGSDHWVLEADRLYELRADPNWSAGALLSDLLFGNYNLGVAPGDDDTGDFIQTGDRVQICSDSQTTLYVRSRTIAGNPAGRWKLLLIN